MSLPFILAKQKKKKKSASLLRGAALPHCARQRRGRTQTQDMPLPRRPVRFRNAIVSGDIFAHKSAPPFLQITQRKFNFSLSSLKYVFLNHTKHLQLKQNNPLCKQDSVISDSAQNKANQAKPNISMNAVSEDERAWYMPALLKQQASKQFTARDNLHAGEGYGKTAACWKRRAH